MKEHNSKSERTKSRLITCFDDWVVLVIEEATTKDQAEIIEKMHMENMFDLAVNDQRVKTTKDERRILNTLTCRKYKAQKKEYYKKWWAANGDRVRAKKREKNKNKNK